jgi:hypothetical protein
MTENRRKCDPELCDVIGTLIDERLQETEDKLMREIDAKFGQLHQTIVDAFPGGDPHGHRQFHEKEIRDAARWDGLKAKVVDKLVTGGVMSMLAFIVLAVWEAFKREVHK